MTGWHVAGPNEKCSTACSSSFPSTPTCKEDRNDAVLSCPKMRFANAAITGDGRTPMQGECSACVLDPNAPNPSFSQSKCHVMNVNNQNAGNCGRISSQVKKLCCCGSGSIAGDALREWCPLQSADCTSSSVWSPSKSLCMPNSVATCPVNSYLKTQSSSPPRLCAPCQSGMTKPAGLQGPDACLCPAGQWKDSVTDPNFPSCKNCVVGKFNPTAGGADVSACSGTADDCGIGRYAASLDAAGMSECAACGGTSGALTPPGSIYCSTPESVRWYLGAAGQNCDAVCTTFSSGSTNGALSCRAVQMNAVTATTFVAVGDALEAEGRTTFATAGCVMPLETVTLTNAAAPFATFENPKWRCAPNGGASSTCAATTTNFKRRVCCCTGVGEKASELCATKAGDCGRGKTWDAATGRCSLCRPGRSVEPRLLPLHLFHANPSHNLTRFPSHI